MSKILYLDEARQHTLSAGPTHLLRLLPGRNVVNEELYETVLNSGSKEKPSRLQEMIETGTVVVHGESLDITKMKVKKIIDIIELETTVEALEDLLTQEIEQKKPRQSVVDAIETKIDVITQAEAAAKEKREKEGGEK